MRQGRVTEISEATQRLATLEQLKDSLDVEAFLEQELGITNWRYDGDELRFSCPLPYGLHKNGDVNPSCSINKVKLKAGCWLCGGGDIFWFAAEVLGISIPEAVRKLSDLLVPRELTQQEFLGQLDRIWSGGDSSPLMMPTYSVRILAAWKRACPYLTERGVIVPVQETMQTGVNLRYREAWERPDSDPVWIEQPRLIIPLFFQGALRGWQARLLDDRRQIGPKYRSSRGYPKQESLFGYDQVGPEASKVVVVESPMSVLRMRSEGIWDVVATHGASVNEPQIDLLRRFQDVVLFMDSDGAGYQGTTKIIDLLGKHVKLWVVPQYPAGTDPADYSRQDLDLMISNAVPAFLWGFGGAKA